MYCDYVCNKASHDGPPSRSARIPYYSLNGDFSIYPVDKVDLVLVFWVYEDEVFTSGHHTV